MRLTERLKTKAATTLFQSDPRAILINGRIIGYADNKVNFINKGYLINDMIYAVVNIVLNKIRQPQWGVYKVVNEQALKSAKGMMMKRELFGSDYLKAIDLWNKAVEPVQGTSKLSELIENPNEQEAFSDFIANSIAYQMLTGDSYIWGMLLQAGANAGLPQELHNLPAQDVSIIATNTFPTREIGYSLNGWRLDFKKTAVLHEKYFNPLSDINGGHLYGLSPLRASLNRIHSNNSNVNATTASFENMGSKKLLYVDDDKFDAADQIASAQMAALKQTIISEYSGSDNAGKVPISGYKMGVADIGLSPVDLALMEAQKWDLRMFCNIFEVPSQLLNDPDNKIMANAKEGEAALTSRCAMPKLIAKRASLNKKLHQDWGFKDKNIIVDFDPTIFTELRQNQKDIAEWTSSVMMITPNEQRTLLGMDALSNIPEADEVMIKQDRTLLSEHQANIVDNELNNGTDPLDSDG